MKTNQLSKRKRVAEKREQRHTGSSSDEKQVTVTGSLGPFSLLLQVSRIGYDKSQAFKGMIDRHSCTQLKDGAYYCYCAYGLRIS